MGTFLVAWSTGVYLAEWKAQDIKDEAWDMSAECWVRGMLGHQFIFQALLSDHLVIGKGWLVNSYHVILMWDITNKHGDPEFQGRNQTGSWFFPSHQKILSSIDNNYCDYLFVTWGQNFVKILLRSSRIKTFSHKQNKQSNYIFA